MRKPTSLGPALAALLLCAAASTAEARQTPPASTALHGQSLSQDQSASEGNNNQAVATTDANAIEPAKGANSFTASQAARRIRARGFSQVAGLIKDGDGIWRGTATQNAKPVKVWLDYKGSVGIQD